MFFKKYRSMLGIGAKTLLSHISLALFVAVLSGVLSYVLTTQYVRESRIDDLARKAGYISESLTHTVVDGRIKPNRRSIRVYQNLAEARLFFLESGPEKPLLWQYDALRDTDDAQQWVDIINAVDLQFFSRVLGGESLSALQQFEFAQGVACVV